MVLGRDRRAAVVVQPGEISAWTVADVARALRRSRTAEGLRVDEVAQGAGVAVRDLRALESGAVDRFPDSLSALRAVRRSADYLGLPGDQLALVLMERWPLRPHRGVASADPTSVVPAIGNGARADEPTTVQSTTRRSGASREALFGAAAAAATGPGTTEVVLAGTEAEEDPDRTEAVPALVGAGAATGNGRARNGAGTDAGDRRGTRRLPPEMAEPAPRRAPPPDDAPPAWLRMAVVAVVLAVLAGVAGIVLSSLHHSPTSSAGTTTATTAAGKKAAKTAPKVAVTTSQTSPTSGTITVSAPTFTVVVSAVGNPAWIQVTAPTQSAPLFASMVYAGQSHSFTVHQSLTVETGSVAGHAAVTVGTKQVTTYVPPEAPYYITFKTA